MTVEEKLAALCVAVDKAWDNTFRGWGWDEPESNSKSYILGEKDTENGYAFFIEGRKYIWCGLFWVEYEPEKDIVGIFIKSRPIKDYLADDLKNLFEKHSPFKMAVTYNEQLTPVISRKENVLPADFFGFFKEFRKAYDEYYPLFYMFTVAAENWYDGFYIEGSDC